ncbi:glutamate 5-kinase [Fructobacillus pseudoficulneus]|uniref:Glutamate 5-kinase n=1 Tax=Fructobacillus pseudoficulneus TaxID=220714 RepID=A0A3F3H4Z6_9LACO|nr:glutamate 5-kinase [Fructobacillus pseudoficulneus]GAP02129.1 glutamate 5-kinase [Fructobacillus pseudoficulneus]SEH35818.1 glutamate 5-kinase [Fructobacillus pseudoficulneus]
MTDWQKIVIKVGTSTIVTEEGRVNYPVINRLAQTLSTLQKEGHQVLLVTSGAIGVALDQMDLPARPKEIPKQQALAAIGQGYLMSTYHQSFAFYKQMVGQVLLTYDVFDNPAMLANTKNAIETLFAEHVIPIINENDVIAVDELDHQHSFGDNDRLAALVANEIQADGLIILSDVDALYTANPNLDPTAQPIHRVKQITDEIRSSATGSTSGLGTGGMSTKLAAADFTMAHHSKMALINGNDPANILQIISGEPIGTLFQGQKS